MATKIQLCDRTKTNGLSEVIKNPKLQIINAKDITSLDKNSQIYELAKSAAIINIKDGFCSGVFISKHAFLTAAHCVTDVTRQNKILNNGDDIILRLSNNKFALSKIEAVAVPKNYAIFTDYYERSSADLAIIMLKDDVTKDNNFHPVPKNSIISVPTLSKEYITEFLTFKMFSSPTKQGTVYSIGGGTQIKVVYNNYDVYSSAESSNLGFYSQKDMKDKNSYNNAANLYFGMDYSVQAEPDLVNGGSYTNIISVINPITEKGDSGGPTFVCSLGNNDCYLVGIHVGSVTGNTKYAITTTLANPNFTEIAAIINK